MSKMQEARARLRKFQMDHGCEITPAKSVAILNMWMDAVNKDPEGSQCLHLIKDLEEQFAPIQQ